MQPSDGRGHLAMAEAMRRGNSRSISLGVLSWSCSMKTCILDRECQKSLHQGTIETPPHGHMGESLWRIPMGNPHGDSPWGIPMGNPHGIPHGIPHGDSPWSKAPFGGWSDPGPHFPRKCCKTIGFYMVWEPARVQNRMNRMNRMKRMNRIKRK